MSKYKIAYIDEAEGDIDDFNLYFDQFLDIIEVVSISPYHKEVEDIVEEVLSKDCDVVVIDFYLKYENSGVPFNGDELLLRIKERKLNIPLLIFTSQMDRAKQGFISFDTLICNKSEINEIEDHSFKTKVIEHIEFYKKLKRKYSSEFAELRLKQEKGLNLTTKEKKRVIELNNLLEEMGDRQLIIKPFENQEDYLKEVTELISKTQEMIDKLPNTDG